ATALNTAAVTAHLDHPPSRFPAAAEVVTVKTAWLTLVRPVAVMPFSASTAAIGAATFQKSTKMNAGLTPHSARHLFASVPTEPVRFREGEFVVLMSVMSGTWMEKAWTVSRKWFCRPR